MIRKLLAVCLILAFVAGVVQAQSPAKFGAGVFGGVSIPILQDDQGNGSEFGAKFRWGLGNIIVLEPHFTATKWGKPDPVDINGTAYDLGIDGSKVTSFGVDAVLGNGIGKMGIAPYFTAGVGSYKVKNNDTGFDHSSFGMSAGLGLGIGLSPQIGLDVRGQAIIIPQDPNGSKKAIGVQAGLNYAFGVGL